MNVISEDNLLLESLINNKMIMRNEGASIEIIVRPDCNQKCKYCYLVQHGKESYPLHTRVDRETTLRNIKLFMDYLTEKKYYVNELDIFAGDLFYDNIFFDFIDDIYNYYAEMHKLYPDKFDRNPRSPAIVIPCNFSFCNDDEKIVKVQQIVDKFSELNMILYFSYSSDGIYSTDVRECREITEEFYDKVLKFCADNHWGAHPMISYENIDNAIKNYDWWKEKYAQHVMDGNTKPSFLEVRNDGWTQDKIDKYLEWLNYVVEDNYKHFNCDINKFVLEYLFPVETIDNVVRNRKEGSDPAQIYFYKSDDNRISCGLGNFDLCVNIANFNLVPCHRLAYPHLSGGHFVLNDDKTKIVGIEANENIAGYLSATTFNSLYKPGCSTCKYRSICMKGCAGSQYETTGELCIPIKSVCNLLKQKNDFLINKYHTMGAYHVFFRQIPNHPERSMVLQMLLDFGYEEYRQYGN